jgi:hypothetical protein
MSVYIIAGHFTSCFPSPRLPPRSAAAPRDLYEERSEEKESNLFMALTIEGCIIDSYIVKSERMS